MITRLGDIGSVGPPVSSLRGVLNLQAVGDRRHVTGVTWEGGGLPGQDHGVRVEVGQDRLITWEDWHCSDAVKIR